MEAIGIIAPFFRFLSLSVDGEVRPVALPPLPALLGEASERGLAATDCADLDELLALWVEASDQITAVMEDVGLPRAEFHTALGKYIDGSARIWSPQAGTFLGDACMARAELGCRDFFWIVRLVSYITEAIRSRPELTARVAGPGGDTLGDFAYGASPTWLRRAWVDLRLSVAAMGIMHHAIQTERRVEPWLALALAERVANAPTRIRQAIAHTNFPEAAASWNRATGELAETEKATLAAWIKAADASGDAVFDPYA